MDDIEIRIRSNQWSCVLSLASLRIAVREVATNVICPKSTLLPSLEMWFEQARSAVVHASSSPPPSTIHPSTIHLLPSRQRTSPPAHPSSPVSEPPSPSQVQHVLCPTLSTSSQTFVSTLSSRLNSQPESHHTTSPVPQRHLQLHLHLRHRIRRVTHPNPRKAFHSHFHTPSTSTPSPMKNIHPRPRPRPRSINQSFQKPHQPTHQPARPR